MILSGFDQECMEQAVQLALEAEAKGNLPIGAVIAHARKIIAEGNNAIWKPDLSPHRHAEMEAMGEIPADLREQTGDMTLYTTLEPCLMCLGAILLYRIGRVVFGSSDGFGGASASFGRLPDYFKEQLEKMDWTGPAYTEVCDPLYMRLKKMRRMRKPGTK